MDLNKNKLLTGSTANTHVGLDSGFSGDVAGRLGYAWDNFLVYGKGGFAFYDGNRTFTTFIQK